MENCINNNSIKKYKKSKKINPFTASTCVMLIFLILYTLLLIGLLVWGVMTSFKDPIDFIDRPYQLPKVFAFENFSKVYQILKVSVDQGNGMVDVTLPYLLIYSILYAFGCCITATFIPCITAYACARFNFKFSKVIYTVVIVTMIIPLVGNLPSEMKVTISLGIYNKIYGLWIMKANFLGVYFLVFYNVFKSLPKSFTEAAKIDGASNFKILVKIAFPLVKNTFMTILLIYFIGFWNDYQTPLLYMPQYPTIANALYQIVQGSVGADTQNTPCKVMAAFLVIIPVLILFLAFQKKLLGNLTVGGVKG